MTAAWMDPERLGFENRPTRGVPLSVENVGSRELCLLCRLGCCWLGPALASPWRSENGSLAGVLQEVERGK